MRLAKAFPIDASTAAPAQPGPDPFPQQARDPRTPGDYRLGKLDAEDNEAKQTAHTIDVVSQPLTNLHGFRNAKHVLNELRWAQRDLEYLNTP